MRAPADFTHHFAELDRLRIHYVREGTEGRLPLLLLHGWPEFWYTFHRNIAVLAEHFDIIAPDHHIEVWYQSFQRLPLAHELVGHSRETVRLYFGHFLRHWSHDKAGRDADLEHFVDAFAAPGRVEASFKWYKSWAEMRLRASREGPPKLPKITPPARLLWGEQDPPNKVAWRDRLGDYFENIEVNTVLDAAHFVHYDQPDLFNAECIKFFTALK